MPQIYPSAQAAIFDITDGATLMSGGFGLCGNPENLIKALFNKGSKKLSIIANNCGTTEDGLGILLANKQVSKMTSSYVGENKEFERQFLQGHLTVELVPQGTLAEKIRAAKAGIPAFYTATGVGTQVSEGGLPMRYNSDGSIQIASSKKEVRKFKDKNYVLEEAISADYSFIHAYKADKAGNLVFRKTARNFNPMMCGAAAINIVEAEHIVEIGELDPDEIHVPGIYVQRLIQGDQYQKWIEQRTITTR